MESVEIVDSFKLSSNLESVLVAILVECTDLADPELIEPVPEIRKTSYISIIFHFKILQPVKRTIQNIRQHLSQ